MQSAMGDLALRVSTQRYALTPRETWSQLSQRVSAAVFGAVVGCPGAAEVTSEIAALIEARKFLPGGRYLYAAGRPLHQVQNCLLLRAEDSREGWADHYYKHVMGLSTGAGIGSLYSSIRRKGAPLGRTGGVAGGPLSLMCGTNEVGRTVRQGGNRRAALWAGLHWWHEDVMDFVLLKNWGEETCRRKREDFDFPAPMDMTNISVCLDDRFFEAGLADGGAARVYWATVRNAVETGDPGFSVDVGVHAGENLRNACTELTSCDDSDICNIGSLNLARFERVEDFGAAVEAATVFLLAGTIYSDVPYDRVAQVRNKNRRLGLGLMGVHEWLLRRGKPYGPDAELEEWLRVYARSTEVAAGWADRWSVSRPVKTRAMAPNGTIGLVAETTTSIEPLLTVALKRRVKEKDRTWSQYVVDPVAARLIKEGVSPDRIETAYDLSSSLGGVERRLAFQAWFQQYVDHGISSTINLPAWGGAANNEDTVRPFGELLYKYLPRLRGVTVYPDGARSGQPIVPVPYKEALRRQNEVVFEQGDVCDLRGGGTCGA